MDYATYKILLSDKPQDFLLSHLSYLKEEALDVLDFEVMIKATLDEIKERKNVR